METGTIASEAAPYLINAHMSLEENVGGKTPEDSSGQMPMRLSEGTATQ